MYLGLDVSTTTIGICVMDENGELLSIKHFTPSYDKKSDKRYKLFQQKQSFVEYIKKNVFEVYDIKHVFIEEPLHRSVNQYTVIILAQFNVLVSEAVYEMGYDVYHISEYEARKNFFPEYCKPKKDKIVFSTPKGVKKKELVLNKLDKMEPDIKWFYNKRGNLAKENYDMADAYVVCKAGIDLIMPTLSNKN